MKKRKEPESVLDELMPVDDLPGMALYFRILRAVGDAIGMAAEANIAVTHTLFPRYRWAAMDLATGMMAVAPFSAVAALWFVPRLVALGLRKVRRPGYYEHEKARRQALAHERRSTRRRTTLNPVPTPEALLAQFARIRRNPREMLIFGSMLEDLEAYVDNSLIRDPDGTIVGRNGGIKQWLRENCAELGKRYHTVMRYKALAKRFKQAIDLEDPVPVAYAIAAAEAPLEVVAGDSEDVANAEGTNLQLRCGRNAEDCCGETRRHGAGKAEGGGTAVMQPRCGQNYGMEDGRFGNSAYMYAGRCVMEAVSPERFKKLRESEYVAEGCRHLARLIAAGQDAKVFLDGCRTTKKNLDERLAMLLEPDMTPASPRVRQHLRAQRGATSAMA